MPAKIGNQHWKKRSKDGRSKKYETAEALWAEAVKYFAWVEKTPIKVNEAVKFQGAGSIMEVPKARPMTERGLCVYLDIGTSTWDRYKNDEDFREVTEAICDIITNQKMEGAMVGLFNANLVARLAGLAEKVDATLNPHESFIASLTGKQE